MPQVNVTIDDVNPLISYGPPGVWQEVGIGGDDLSVHYFDQTRMGSPVLGATASFSFYGSAIWLFGAKRSDHGNYNVTLDGTTSSLTGTGNEVYQTVIFNAPGLTLGNHSISLTNAQVNESLPWVDLDYIIWQTEIGQEDDSLIATNIDDAEPAFSYQPQGAWSTNPPNVSGFSNSTGHNTVTDGAFATFSFTGTAVEIFGTVGAANSNYSVQLDDNQPITYNAMRLNFYPQVPLYFATGLAPGNHTLKVSNKPTSPGLGLSIDYASITGTTKSPPYANTMSPNSGSSHTSGHHMSIGTIIAIAIPTLIVVALVAIVVGILRRRRRPRGIAYIDIDEPASVPYLGYSSVPLTEQQRNYDTDHAQIYQIGTTPPASAGLPPSEPAPGALSLSSSRRSYTSLSKSHASTASSLSGSDATQPLEAIHRDAGVSLGGDQLPPPDYREATTSWL